ncbi:hypothetical protein FC82_GL003281 [Secundilactobacillus collinoides DSM 20515 = JCM 1123]|uniref:Uncharacterized protein n=1 Tax=Secundilactobacillus collinoides DSM 20515 = JCM 1123 TaxID=1423733 RepID=A0A0R2BDL1_SECCO|nr:hypothetical protein FC82_GL003281 [Secundilactobacillus collinoides DSM 20515 = JCM 1123]
MQPNKAPQTKSNFGIFVWGALFSMIKPAFCHPQLRRINQTFDFRETFWATESRLVE